MRKYCLSAITLFVFFGLLTSCTSVKTLVLDVDKPASLTLPSTVQNITIVNNSVTQPYEVGHSESIMGRLSNSTITVNNDSIDYILMQSAGEEISSMGYFDKINLYEYPTRSDNAYNEIIPLKKEDVIDIANDTDTDVVLSIDRIFISTNTNTLPADDYIADIYNVLDLKADIWYNLYNKQGENLLQTITDGDSIFWIEARSNHLLLSDPIPSREDAMKVGATLLASKLAFVLTPHKVSENRIFYSDIKEAQALADNNEWDKAQSVWIAAFDKEKKTKPKARIANNIALSYELPDNLIEALKWNQTSIDLFKNSQITSTDLQFLESAKAYKQVLLERFQDFKILDLNQRSKE